MSPFKKELTLTNVKVNVTDREVPKNRKEIVSGRQEIDIDELLDDSLTSSSFVKDR